MSRERPILFRNARLVDPAGGTEQRGGLLVRGGAIADLGPGLREAMDAVVVECGGQVLAPGLVDMRAFIGEPGAEHRETFETASKAAAAGGVTTVVTMPDTNPVLDDPAIIDFVLRRAGEKAIVNVRPAAALTKAGVAAKGALAGRKEAAAVKRRFGGTRPHAPWPCV